MKNVERSRKMNTKCIIPFTLELTILTSGLENIAEYQEMPSVHTLIPTSTLMELLKGSYGSSNRLTDPFKFLIWILFFSL